MKLWDTIKTAMLKRPMQIICEDNAEMTYEEIVVYSEIFSKKLSNERCCAILCDSEMTAAIALLGCFAAGVTAVPLSRKYGAAHCKKILKFISPSAIITDWDGILKLTHIKDSEYEEPYKHPALIMCTSGTTGEPKGVMLTEENLLTNIRDISSYLSISFKDYILISRPLYHSAVLTGEFLTSLFKGVKIRFYSDDFNPKILTNMISEYEITVFCGTPTILSMLAKFNRNNECDSLRVISISGECMGFETGRRIRAAFPKAEIYHVYGLTEASPRVSYLPSNLFETHPDSVGILLDSVMLSIVKPDGSFAKTGEDGVLWIKGKNIMTGYYKNPELTNKILKDGWLCTGDIVNVDYDGLIRIKGRIDDLIIRAGMNIYPQEVENALKTDPRVKDVLVYKINDPKRGVQIGLKLSGEFTDTDEVKILCYDVLPLYQVPTMIELLDELPKNITGKIIRRNVND